MRVALDKKRFGPWALVTGASSGIGKECARQIAASGINIVLVARREDLLKEVGVEVSRRYGVEHRVVVLDVSREDFIGQLVSATEDLDIGLVVSNAGTGNPRRLCGSVRWRIWTSPTISARNSPSGGGAA